MTPRLSETKGRRMRTEMRGEAGAWSASRGTVLGGGTERADGRRHMVTTQEKTRQTSRRVEAAFR